MSTIFYVSIILSTDKQFFLIRGKTNANGMKKVNTEKPSMRRKKLVRELHGQMLDVMKLVSFLPILS